MSVLQKSLFAIPEVAARWAVSPFTIRRLINAGDLRSITIGARRLLPLAEIERAEQFGVGKARKVVAR